jgi:hypothetical protein
MKKRIPYSIILRSMFFIVGFCVPSATVHAHPQALITFHRLQKENSREPTPLRSTQILEILLVQEECSRGVSSGKEYHQKFPEDLDLSIAYAKIAICAHKYDIAASVLDDAEKTHGPSLRVSLTRLELFEAQGREDTGALALKIVNSYDDAEPDIYIQAALRGDNGAQSNEASSVKILKQGIKRHPASISLWLTLLLVQEQRGALCDAVETVKEMRSHFPSLNKEVWDLKQKTLLDRCSGR